MKNYKIAILFLSITFSLVLASCKKGLLDVAPPDQLSTTVFWQTEADADLALTGLYNYLYAGNSGYATSQYTIMAWDNYSDDSYGQYNYGGGTSALTSGITPNSGDFVYSYYYNNYRAIAAINAFLANVEKVLTGDKLATYKGEAYFLRAFNYFWLAQLYGNVPIIKDDPFSVDYKSGLAKSDRADVLRFIEQDLDAAGVH